MEHYGIRGVASKWSENYLAGRKQSVKFCETQSEEMCIRSGFSQGSVLGPSLFIIYIHDIQNCSKLVSLVLFADHTNILYSHQCLKVPLQRIFQPHFYWLG